MFQISTCPPYFMFLNANLIVKIVCHFQRCEMNVGFNTTLCNFHTPLPEVSRFHSKNCKIIH